MIQSVKLNVVDMLEEKADHRVLVLLVEAFIRSLFNQIPAAQLKFDARIPTTMLIGASAVEHQAMDFAVVEAWPPTKNSKDFLMSGDEQEWFHVRPNATLCRARRASEPATS